MINLTFKSIRNVESISYEILEESKVFSRLEFEYHLLKRFQTLNRATATIDDEKFELGGWLYVNTDIKVKNSKTNKVIAKYYSRVLSYKGKLIIGGKKYTFMRKNSGKLEYAWISEKGEETVTYKLEGFMLNKGEINISTEIEKDPNLKLLIIVGLYQIMLGGSWQITASKPATIALYVILAILILILLTAFMFRASSFVELIDVLQNILTK